MWAYFKSTSFYLMFSYMVLMLMSSVCIVSGGFWLSQWTNSNIGIKSSMDMSPGWRLAIFSLFGSFDSKSINHS